MSSQTLHRNTLATYLALELNSDARHEYWQGEIVCMSGGSKEHSQICSNLHFQLRSRLKSSGCKAFTSEQPVTALNYLLYCYPDISVVCGNPTYEQISGIDILTNPTLLVEVLLPQSKKRDKETKLKIYKEMPSLQEYIIVAQDQPLISQYTRQNQGRWRLHHIIGLESNLTLSSLASTLPLNEIYEDVTFKTYQELQP